MLFRSTNEYTPRQYYEPWLDIENASPRWVKVHKPRHVDNNQYGDQLKFTNNPINLPSDTDSGRHFKPETIFRITETLGAINTVGRYLVNMTRGDRDKSISQDVPNALYTISKNVLGRNVTDTIAPLVREALPIPQKDAEEKTDNNSEDETNGGDTRYCTTPEGLPG